MVRKHAPMPLRTSALQARFLAPTAEPNPSVIHRNSIGGRAILAEALEPPQCGLCRREMILLFQADLDAVQFDVPLRHSAHMTVFVCPVHNEEPTTFQEADNQLPEKFWEMGYGHYRLCIFPTGGDEKTLPLEANVQHNKLDASSREEVIDWDGYIERGLPGFKIGGIPTWVEEPRMLRCSCHAEMIFVCQVPQGFRFPRSKKGIPQTAALFDDGYCLFMGWHTYIFACRELCTPYSLWAVAQDPSPST